MAYEQLTIFPEEPKKKGFFDNIFMPGGFFNPNSNANPNSNPNIKGFFAKAAKPQFDYKLNTGLQGWGKNLGGYATAINGGIQGVRALKGIHDLSEARSSSGDLQSDIINASYNSPMLAYDLNKDQIDLLNQLKRGSYSGDRVNIDDIDPLGVLGDTAMGALTGLPGGWIGALVGGIGGLANSVIGDLGNAQNQSNAELEALYQAVLDSERQYKDIKKQQAYARLMQY